jgi:ABC-type transport system substrate-binding protein
MTLTRNESYYGTPGVLDEIVIPWITDATQQPAAMENGEADVIFPQAQLDLVEQTEGIQGIETFIGFGTFWEHMDFNFENTFLAELEVRQAIGLGVDREDIVARLVDPFDDSAEVLNNRIFFPGATPTSRTARRSTGPATSRRLGRCSRMPASPRAPTGCSSGTGSRSRSGSRGATPTPAGSSRPS